MYEGEWYDGVQHGEGAVYTMNDLKQVLKGTWNHGEFKF